MCNVGAFNVGVRGEQLIEFEDFVGEKVGYELTPESSLVLLIRFVGRTVGAQDSATIGKRIESSVTVSCGLLSFCTRRSVNCLEKSSRCVSEVSYSSIIDGKDSPLG